MSNTLKRVIVGIIAIPIFLLIIYLGGMYFAILSFIICSIALWEFYSMFQLKGFNIFKYTSIFLSLFLIMFYAFNMNYLLFGLDDGGTTYLTCGIVIFLMPLIIMEMFRNKEMNPLNVLISFMGFLYIAFPILLMNKMVNPESLKVPGFYLSTGEFDGNYLLYIIILVWVCDTFAYFGGKMFGKHQLSIISPKKTIEGSVIGFIFTVAFSFLFHLIAPESVSIREALIIGILVGVFAQVGDLFESLLKRYCGVKDSSQSIPGHGGVLDRFDSLIFITPIIYLYLSYDWYFS